jgi:hypothetical protein
MLYIMIPILLITNYYQKMDLQFFYDVINLNAKLLVDLFIMLNYLYLKERNLDNYKLGHSNYY